MTGGSLSTFINEKTDPRLLRGARSLLILAALALSGCLFRPGPATAPMRTLEIPGGSPESGCLMILLPGRGDTPEHFVRNGFPEDLRRAGSRCVLLGVDAHLGYYYDKSVVNRLEEDVIAPARARGFEKIWLVGISLGGFGSLLYTKDHPGEIAGIVAIAPFLGDRELTDEIAEAGGVESWTPRKSYEKDFLAFWTWLKGYRSTTTGVDAEHPPLFLVYGEGDRFARPNGLLADLLPGDHVYRVRGGHTWAAWRRGWDAFLESEFVPGR